MERVDKKEEKSSKRVSDRDIDKQQLDIDSWNIDKQQDNQQDNQQEVIPLYNI